jgi:hypothetical protein
MSSNRIIKPATATELTADQLQLVHGGIIIVGGKVSRSDGILAVSGVIASVARWFFA